MRKNSTLILKEIRLDRALETFEHIERLRQAIDDFLNFRTNELDALITMIELTKGDDLLSEYVEEKVINHYRSIIGLLGMTTEGFREYIKYMEEEHKKYEQIRNQARSKIHRQPTEKLH